MADIELIIKIPEEAKQAFDCAESNDLKGCYYDHGGVVGNAIKNGTPLPKGHGRLIDADELYDGFIDGTEGYDCQTWSRIEIGDIIEDAPTIIEADAESENKTN